jgi:hypothetical protein
VARPHEDAARLGASLRPDARASATTIGRLTTGDDDPSESVTRPRAAASEGRSEQRHPDQGADKVATATGRAAPDACAFTKRQRVNLQVDHGRLRTGRRRVESPRPLTGFFYDRTTHRSPRQDGATMKSQRRAARASGEDRR